MKKLTQKDVVKKHLLEHGHIDNHFAIDTRLTTRLAAIIGLLREEGMKIDTIRHLNGTKDTRYVLTERPKRYEYVLVDGVRVPRLVEV